MGKKNKLQRLIENTLIQDAIRTAQEGKLANPALGTHALVMFAIENFKLFAEWVNEDAGLVEGDTPKTDHEIEQYLERLHKLIHAAMVASIVDLPNGTNVRVVSIRRHKSDTGE